MKNKERSTAFGALLFANLIWGFQAIYWKQLINIELSGILVHRIVWGAFFAIVMLTMQKRWGELKQAVRNVKDVGFILLNSVLLGGNWLVFIWLVNTNRIVELSLGHFISPLLVILFGCFIYKEPSTRGQRIAFVFALVAVIYQILVLGYIPWGAFIVATVFSGFALTKKMSHLESLPALTLDTLILATTTLIWIKTQSGSFFYSETSTNMLLVGGGLITVLPMILYAFGARMCGLKITGILQYLSPVLSLLIGVFVYNEPFGMGKLITFALIWTGLLICTAEALFKFKETAN